MADAHPMNSGAEQDSGLGSRGEHAVLPRIGEMIPEITERFERFGVLGLMLVDASVLASVELRHGDAARVGALGALGNPRAPHSTLATRDVPGGQSAG